MAYMSEEGYKKLVAELQYLESVRRPEIVQQIADARDKGDLTENAEYDAAKEAQGILEAKIANLKALIIDAKLIDESMIDTSTVQILTTVKLRNLKNQSVVAYSIVPENEADLRSGKISSNTPIAKGLLGHKVGDTVEIAIPSGKISFEILDITL
ncbi:MAG TPA: transcription elongation factor GreA [Bacteroidaceae bacterium]|jgi:transcription elongation factor GreA|nr:transcription elongation factor GreA [Bacteroidaceae bacterium]HOD68243.1 transcription elongation factor GreA [Bacteroidaceae bacterium]HPB03681.1 transcription elongation factor GreA [Bacteroidaceae bacterium]HPX98895.1 transcription elongation factor GreA [Bacteroidaceae bacterium]HQL26202.1 transcription elongation factor GreA [Bacteroidaceae bacterium]